MYKVHFSILNGYSQQSIAYRFRKRRMEFFEEWFRSCFLKEKEGKVRVKLLDLGGVYEFWKTLDFAYINYCDFCLMNINEVDPIEGVDNFKWIVGDATDLSKYDDKTVDLCFSNSVIEHVGGIENKKKMAREMERVGRHIYLQTPNFWFPFEPHFKMFFFHWMPYSFRIWLLMHFKIGYFNKCYTHKEASDILLHNSILKYSELKELFPHAEIHRERFLWMTKSFYLTI